MNDRQGRKTLVLIHNDEPDELLADRALIQGELRTLDSEDESDLGALQIITRKIKELVGNRSGLLVNHRWRLYLND